LIPQNTTDSGRIGDTLEIKDVKINFTFSSNAISTRDVRMRLFLVKCGQTTPGGSPPTTDILWDATDIRSGIRDKREQVGGVPFTILKEWNFTLQPPPVAGIDTKYLNFEYRPKGCHSVTWTDADVGGLTANLIDGSLRLFGMYETFGAAGAPMTNIWQEFSYVDA